MLCTVWERRNGNGMNTGTGTVSGVGMNGMNGNAGTVSGEGKNGNGMNVKCGPDNVQRC